MSAKQLYVPPSIDFVPYIYTPLYFYASAIISKLFGVGFPALRCVSFASSLGSFVLIYALVKQETRKVFPALVSTGLFVATFSIAGAWFDLARVDSMFLLFLLASVFALRVRDSLTWTFLSAALLFVSFLTKQVAAFLLPVVTVYLLMVDRKRALVYLSTFGSLILLSTILLENASGGWYSYYVFVLPTRHAILKNLAILFWVDDLIRPLPICVALGLALVSWKSETGPGDKWFWGLLSIGMIGISFFSRLHLGGWDNVLMPAYAIIMLCGGIGFNQLMKQIQVSDIPSARGMRNFLYLLVAIQFLALVYNPFSKLPSRADAEAGKQVVQVIRAIPGEVYVPEHGYLALEAGKRSYAHAQAVSDVLRSGDSNSFLLEQEIRTAILNGAFKAVILSEDYGLEDLLRIRYVKVNSLFGRKDVFLPVTGDAKRPENLYVRRE
jgi:4-amino-4-deoxy-L-arabinose transferase-like glycosyltransferase